VVHGHGHAEFGHIPTDRIENDEFVGSCAYHGSCLEGMASGSAIEARRQAGDPDPTRFAAGYLAQLVQTLTYTFAPDVISFGGGVFNIPRLIDDIRTQATARLSGYSTNAPLVDDMDTYVVRSPLGQDAGLVGAAILGMRSIGVEPSTT
jgi:fructokinase